MLAGLMQNEETALPEATFLADLDLVDDLLWHDCLQQLHCFCVLVSRPIHEALQPSCISLHSRVQVNSGMELFSPHGLSAGTRN